MFRILYKSSRSVVYFWCSNILILVSTAKEKHHAHTHMNIKKEIEWCENIYFLVKWTMTQSFVFPVFLFPLLELCIRVCRHCFNSISISGKTSSNELNLSQKEILFRHLLSTLVMILSMATRRMICFRSRETFLCAITYVTVPKLYFILLFFALSLSGWVVYERLHVCQ